jgi:hypothetical protein
MGNFPKAPKTIEKMAVVAPIPNAKMSTAVKANPGDFRSCRKTSFRSERILTLGLLEDQLAIGRHGVMSVCSDQKDSWRGSAPGQGKGWEGGKVNDPEDGGRRDARGVFREGKHLHGHSGFRPKNFPLQRPGASRSG